MRALNELNIGEEATVANMECGSRRLRDLGLVEGTRVKCVLKSPLGDPCAYKIRGAVIAIRKEDASQIAVEVFCHE